MDVRKDNSIDRLASTGNVAQFVSFEPACQPAQTFSRIWEHPPNYRFASPDDAIRALLAKSPERSINLRSFTPDSPRSREFLYGLTDASVATAQLYRLIGEGLFVIANETVDVSDGGVSGVIEGGVIEFAPDDTPRCVEKDGAASFLLEDGLSILETVYGFRPELPDVEGKRLEFSIHPTARGYKRTHTLLWECESVATSEQTVEISWPNKFSRLVGDKVFGLLVANIIGIPVPRSVVISRRIRPFSFGRDTDSRESWLRTSPTEQNPGRFTTINKWVDPFALLANEDPRHTSISSVISQSAVPPRYSGAAITKKDGRLHIEGKTGAGDDFMLGRAMPEQLPDSVVRDLQQTNKKIRERLGPVRFEWVHDGKQIWIVQLHKGATKSTTTVIVPGEASEWATFRTENGLESLRELIATLPAKVGLHLQGEVGLTSHVADLLRKSGRPSRVIPNKSRSSYQLLLDLDG